MTQERIYSYFQRNPQLHVLFIFDNISIKYLMELGSTLNITLNTHGKRNVWYYSSH